MEIEIRAICPEDATQVWALRKMQGVMENILALPDERIDFVEGFINGLGEHSHQFVAVVKEDGRELVAGTAGLHTGTGRQRHSAGLGIMVHKDFQGKGIGKALMHALIDLADNWLMLVRLELCVFADNEKAIALYEKMGFEVEGKRKMASIRAGEYADELSMSRIHPKFSLTK